MNGTGHGKGHGNEQAWSEVADSLEALASALTPKPHHRERSARKAAAGPPPADPIRGLATRITEVMTTVGGAVHDPAASERTAAVARAVEQALRETAQAIPTAGRHAARPPVEPARHPGDVLQAAEDDGDPRRVLFTGPRSRLVVTTLRPGERTGTETHHADQVVLLLKGTGECVIDGRARAFTGSDALCVPAGTRQDVRNTGTEPMRIATVYAPARHPAGMVHPAGAVPPAGTVHRAEAAAHAA